MGTVDFMLTPGATRSNSLPLLEESAILPFLSTEPTAMTFDAQAGEVNPEVPEFPAETTTIIPLETTLLTDIAKGS